MKSLLILMLASLWVPGACSAEATPGKKPALKVSGDFRNVPLRDAVHTLLRDVDQECRVDAEVADLKVDVGFRNVSVETALRLLVDAAREQQLRIELSSASPNRFDIRIGEKKISLDLRAVPLRKCIEMIFAGSGLQCAVDANVPDVPVTLKLEEMSLPRAMRLVIKEAGKQVPGLTMSRD